MNSSGKINYYFRKYPLLRSITAIFIIAIILGSVFLISNKTKAVPEIESIVPPVGAPGDVVLINGKNFGNIRDMNYVEFAGAKLTSSSYISWTDNCIKVVLPSNVQDGLVVVGVKDMRSKPSLFANEVDIPVPVPPAQTSSRPVISSISGEKVRTGDVITITGSNFGDSRNQSRVLFTIDYGNKIKNADYLTSALLTENMIPVSENENGYVFWSNTEIRVRVPDGACTGVVQVESGKEKSDAKNITIDTSNGTKEFLNKKIYLVQYSADIADVVTSDVSTITLRCPVPVTTCYQPNVEITEMNPEPILTNYQNNLIHQITKNRNNTPKSVFKQTFVLPVFEVHTKINVDKISQLKEKDRLIFGEYLREDDLIPSADEKIINLAKEIAGKEKNPYRIAKAVYSYMQENYKLLQKNRKNDDKPRDMIRSKKGDAYDFAVIYTALLRANGIPAVTDGGVLIDQDLKTQSHWWCEFYLSGYGWIPVDPALGAGLDYKKWTENEGENNFYFGNMDSHHVVFSRGFKQLKPFTSDNKTVQHPRSFALQSIWEEASVNTAKYSSYWSVPVIRGVY